MSENPSGPRLHIAFVIGSMQVGGAQRMTANLIGFLSRRGVRVTLITLDPKPSAFSLPDSVELIAPVASRPFKRDISSGFRVLRFLRKSINSSQAEIVISFLFPSLFLAASTGLKKKKVISIRNNPGVYEFPDNIALRRILFPFADAILCQTKYARDIIYRQTGHQNIDVLPNFLEDKFLDTDIEPIYARSKRIIYVGRLVEGKGLYDLIWAFAAGLDKEWTLLLVGSGPLEAELRECASDLNVLDRVVFTGAVSDVRPFLKSAQIFAFCSRSEGFPNALLEAMSQGLCCISYDCNAGPSDLISDGVDGFLIEVGDKQAFRNKLKELSAEPGVIKAIGSSAEKIKARYCQKVVGKRFLECLKALLDQQR